MLNGFSEQTQPLTEYENNVILPVVIQGLMQKVGRSHAVTNSHICLCLKHRGFKATEPRIRKVINHIRTNGLVIGLIATSEGYYIAQSKYEIDEYLESLRGREQAIRAVRMSLERQRDNMYG